MKKKYGFVYLWFDRKNKRYYLGSHWGRKNDGYICSSRWMKKAYLRRPEDFKRRIISKVYISRLDLLDEEHRYLKMIKPEEIKIRYYNLRTHHPGHWATLSPKTKAIISAKSREKQRLFWKKYPEKYIRMKKRQKASLSTELARKKNSERTKIVMNTEAVKKKLSVLAKGRPSTKPNSLGYRCLVRNGSGFLVRKWINGRGVYLGTYRTIKEAVKAHNLHPVETSV